ncbi:hypothetical protein [Dyadobacter sp. OTU695]|uniref:hypothetical protein n=1 Tax=Dyadobacter sp. OTU695 TaxID=3043860 RepID=UPI00313BDECA
MNVQYLSNEKGEGVVQISIEDWKNIQAKLKRGAFLTSFAEALVELKLMKKGILPEPEIDELFDDSDDPISGDFWDELPDHVKESIDLGLQQSLAGQTKPHEEVMKKFVKYL